MSGEGVEVETGRLVVSFGLNAEGKSGFQIWLPSSEEVAPLTVLGVLDALHEMLRLRYAAALAQGLAGADPDEE